MLRRLALAVLALAVLAAPVQAAPAIDAKGAEAFKVLLAKTLADYESTMMVGSPVRIVKEGDLTVEVAQGYYAATLPSITLVGPPGPNGQPVVRVGIGRIAVNAIPREREGLYILAVAVPPTMHVAINQDQAPESVEVTIGEQKAHIVTWDSTLDARWGVPFAGVLKVQSDHRGITVRANSGQESALEVKIAALRYDQGYVLDSGGRLSGPVALVLEGVSAAASAPSKAANGFKLSLGSFGVSGRAEGIDADGTMAQVKAFAEVQGRLNAAMDAGQEISGQDGIALFDAVAGLYTRILSSMELAYTLRDLSVDWADASRPMDEVGAQPRAGFTLAEAGLAVRFAGFDGNAASANKSLTFKGLAITPPPAGVGPAIPAEGRLHVAVEGLPVQAVLAKVREAIVAGTQDPDMGPMVLMGLMAQMPAQLAEAGVKVSLSDTGVGNAVYALSAEGDGKPTPVGAEGTLRVIFAGLDALAAALQAEGQKGPEAATAAMPVVASLQQAKALGEQAGGKDEYTFAFALGADGKVTLNGQPFPPAAPPPAQVPSLEPTESTPVQQ